MRAYVNSPEHLSIAMQRVAIALKRHKPRGIEIVSNPEDAEFHVLHVIAPDAVPFAAELGKPYAVLQYCHVSAGGHWASLWAGAKVVWSYYPLGDEMPDGPIFYHAPLGVDGRIFCRSSNDRDIGVMTSGYVTGPGAEPIEEMAIAAESLRLRVRHLGPSIIQGQQKQFGWGWKSVHGISDEVLAAYYGRTRWVSGLRHVEGFELPVIEGLACGARPIVFDRPDMRQWYHEHAMFVPECSGEPLIEALKAVLAQTPPPITRDEREKVLATFSWEDFAMGLWKRVLA